MSTTLNDGNGPDDVVAKMIWANRNLGTDPSWWESKLDASDDPSGAHEWPVFAGGEPGRPDNCITVYETTPVFGAKLMPTGEVMQHYGITVRVRGRTKKIARARAEALRQDFNKSCTDQTVTLDGSTYLIPSLPRVTLVPVGREAPASQRWLFNLNCLLVIVTHPLTGV